MTYFLHYSHYLKRTRRHINRHYSCLFAACPKLLSLFESAADSSCYCNYWSYCFYCYIWWMYFVRQLFRMTMLQTNQQKKCISCDAEFASKRAADCHRRHPAYNGTACAYPSNIWSLSLTERPDIFGWNSSPTQCCATRCVNVHLTSAIYILYQPFQLKSKSLDPNTDNNHNNHNKYK